MLESLCDFRRRGRALEIAADHALKVIGRHRPKLFGLRQVLAEAVRHPDAVKIKEYSPDHH